MSLERSIKPEIAAVDVGEQSLAPKLAKHRLVFAQEPEVRHDRFDRHDVVAVFVGAFDRRLDALLEIRDQVTGIAAENLVATLPAEHHLHVFGGKLRHHELRKRSGPGDRKIHMPDHVADTGCEVVGADVDDVKLGRGLSGSELRVVRFIVTGIVGEATMKAHPVARIDLGGEAQPSGWNRCRLICSEPIGTSARRCNAMLSSNSSRNRRSK